jgi:hypothetical protein
MRRVRSEVAQGRTHADRPDFHKQIGQEKPEGIALQRVTADSFPERAEESVIGVGG